MTTTQTTIVHPQTRYSLPNTPSEPETTDVTCTRTHSETTLCIPIGNAKENVARVRRIV